MSPPVNWIVPLRRLVVTSTCGYPEVLTGWLDALKSAEMALKSWYLDRQSGDPAKGYRWLQSVIGGLQTERAPSAASPKQPNSFDTSPPCFVRLWKGPHRVLNVTETDESIGCDNAQREVRALGATFFPGDIIEVPVHRFLASCQRTKSNISDTLWSMQFNGEGSPFLGNTVVHPSGTIPAEYTLHDNLLGMRMQLMLNLALAAFFDSKKVYKNESTGELGTVEGKRLWGRGMMYGATLKNQRLDTTWRLSSYNWGKKDGLKAVRPNDKSFDSVFNLDQPLTPAWSCSPATLSLTTFLLDGTPGKSDVNSSCKEGKIATVPARVPLASMIGPKPEEAVSVRLIPTDGSVPEWGAIGDLSISSLQKHEQAMVLLRPPQTLLEHTAPGGGPPVAGFLSAFNPATGADYCDDPALHKSGQLYLFEATGSLNVKVTPTVIGTRAFNWRKVVDNTVTFQRTKKKGKHGIKYATEAAKKPPGQYFNEFLWFTLGDATPKAGTAEPIYKPGQAYLPIAVGNDQTKNLSRDGSDGDYLKLYAERAVPFLTLKEYIKHAGYPNASVLKAALPKADALAVPASDEA